MKEVEESVLELDGSVRAVAFGMMSSYILAGQEFGPPPSPAGLPDVEGVSLEEFFSQREIKKPADAVFAIAAYLYQEYGTEPLSPDEINELADRVGLTVPRRPDMTLKSTRNGKPLFRAAGRGMYVPTVYGESWLKETFQVSKGRKKRAPIEAGK
jgi:hypothetical protein